MKFKETKNGNVNLTISVHELNVLNSILSYVRLGASEESAVVGEVLNIFEYFTDEDHDVSFTYTADEGIVINV